MKKYLVDTQLICNKLMTSIFKEKKYNEFHLNVVLLSICHRQVIPKKKKNLKINVFLLHSIMYRLKYILYIILKIKIFV